MLSRGIDPNVLDPSLCHSHPDVPDAWPSKEQLLEYLSQVGWAGLVIHCAFYGFHAGSAMVAAGLVRGRDFPLSVW